MNCPNCHQPMCGVQYAYNEPEAYDGVSEWICEHGCGVRIGRWSKRALAPDEIEGRYGRQVPLKET